MDNHGYPPIPILIPMVLGRLVSLRTCSRGNLLKDKPSIVFLGGDLFTESRLNIFLSRIYTQIIP